MTAVLLVLAGWGFALSALGQVAGVFDVPWTPALPAVLAVVCGVVGGTVAVTRRGTR